MSKCLILSLFFILFGQAAFAATTEEIIEAFKQDKDVQAEIDKLRNRVEEGPEEIEVVSLGGSCGVVGCYFYDLVVLRISTRGGRANPRTGTVLAKVDGLNGKIRKVSLVEITPKKMEVQ